MNMSRINPDRTPWTLHDQKLFTELSYDDQAKVQDWIKENFIPLKKKGFLEGATSYKFRELCVVDCDVEITHNQFKHAMLICGFIPDNEYEYRWRFNISKHSPIYKRMKGKVNP